MSLTFDLPSPTSFLSRRDPRWKLLGIFSFMICVALIQHWPAVLLAFFISLLLIQWAQIPWKWYAGRIGIVSFFLVVFLIWLPLFSPHNQIHWGPLRISLGGLLLFFTLWFKALTLITLTLILLITSPWHETLKAAHALKIPGIFVQIMGMSIRYIFLLAEEFSRLRTAMRVRGYRSRMEMRAYRVVGQIAGTLLVRSQERAERVHQAMLARGFDGCYRSLHPFKTQSADVLLALGFWGLSVGIIAMEWIFPLK